MDNLRLILFVIGCLVVLGIYLWDIFFKEEPKKRTDMLDAVDELPDMPMPIINNRNTEDHHHAMTDLGNLLTEARNNSVDRNNNPEISLPKEELKEEEADNKLPLDMSVKDYEASMSMDNHCLLYTSDAADD